MSGEHLLKMAEEGTLLGTDETYTVEFAGKTWYVKASIGNPTGLVLVLSADDEPAPVTDVLRAVTRSAAALVAGIGGVPDDKMRNMFLDLVSTEIDTALHTFAMAKAARGKPS